MDFTRDELITINNALNEVLNGPEAISEPEFNTRVGTTKKEALGVLNKIDTFLKQAH